MKTFSLLAAFIVVVAFTDAAPTAGSIHHVESEEDFDEQVKNAGSKLVVVDFFATWCGPCDRIAPVLEELAQKYASKIVVLKVDVDELEELAMERFKVKSMPTFAFLKNGEVVDQFSGAIAEAVEDSINKFA